ncbi:MAG: hypothetical protein V7603_4600 [Micromonosporaceae bacterium]
MVREMLRGAAAGAAGTTVLNAVTYVDMALRARPASSTPERTVDTIANRLGHPVPGGNGARGNRLTGLGALSGIATGIGIGAVFGALRACGLRLPAAAEAVLVGAAAMAATDGAMAGLGVSDPRTWPASAWLSDAVPHLAYGAATSATLRALDRG